MLHQFHEFLKPGNGYGQVISNKTEIVLSNDTVELWFFRMCDIRTCSNCFPKFEKKSLPDTYSGSTKLKG